MWQEHRGCVCLKTSPMLEVAEKQVNSGYFHFILHFSCACFITCSVPSAIHVKHSLWVHIFQQLAVGVLHLFTSSSTFHVDMIAQSHP